MQEENNAYRNTAIFFLELILELEAGDISQQELFDTVKQIVDPTVYDILYHKIVKKDFLGFTSTLDSADDISDKYLDDTDELILKD